MPEGSLRRVAGALLADPNSPWQEYRGRGPITKNQVAVLLRDYDIRPAVVHPTKRADFSRHGYRAAQFSLRTRLRSYRYGDDPLIVGWSWYTNPFFVEACLTSVFPTARTF